MATQATMQRAAAFDARPFTSRWVADWVRDRPDERHRRLDPAALLFLDISGFTAMSEMLADLGRIGAEEVREVVNKTFTDLLDIAYANGASLLKFGGDALLLLFVGEDAHLAASVTAWDVRAALHGANPVTTAGGQLDLDLTIGVHAGAVDLFLVGDLHRELVVAGPAATAVIETEGAADKGQVLVSPDLRQLLPDDCTALDDQGRIELVRRPVHAAPRRARGEVAELPEGVHLLSGPVEAHVTEDHSSSHRHATIAFVHFSGTDALADAEGPEAVAEALHELVSVTQAACERADVCFLASDIDADGGKLILTAGVPTGGDDDDERMLNACRRIVEANPRLHVQIGVNRGPIFSGVVGPPYRLTYTVLGDAVNLAARIMARADHGELLAETGVLNRSRTLFEVEPLEPFNVKGKVAPVRAARVGEEAGVRVRGRSDGGVLHGRGDELERLLGAMDRAIASRRGSSLGLVGPAGIGKSRLVDELQERRPDVAFHLVACSRFGAERPYRAAGMLLRLVLTGERHGAPEAVVAAADRLAAADPEIKGLLPLLGDVMDVDVPATEATRTLDPAFRGSQTRRLLGLLLMQALTGPTCLVVEDVQWLDPESRELLRDLARQIVPLEPWVLLGTTRAHDELVDGMQPVEVPPLDEASVTGMLLAAVDDGHIAVDLVPAIARRADGNPLFLQELVTAAGDGELPDSLESLFQQRIDRLPVRQRRLVAHAAVLGVEFPPELLTAVVEDRAPSPDELADLSEILRSMRSGYLRFTHSLYQEVAYTGLPFRERRALHRAAARAMERLQQGGAIIAIEGLSRHHHLGGEYENSWRSSRQAFAVARGRSAVESAARFARRALEAGRRIGAPDRAMARVYEGLGDVLVLAGSFAEAEDAYRSARTHADELTQARLCRQVGHVKERVGQYSQALRWYSKSLGALGDRTDEEARLEQAQTSVRRAVTFLRQARYVRALSAAEELLARGRELPDEERALALWVLGWGKSSLQDVESTATLEAAAELFGRLGNLGMQANVVNATGADAYYRGDWDEASSRYRRAGELWQQAGDRGNTALTDANLGEVLADQGRFDEARPKLLSAHDFGRASGHEIARMFPMLVLGRLESRVGAFDVAESWLAEVEAVATKDGAAGFAAEARLRLAELHWFRGDPEGADGWLERAHAVGHGALHPGLASLDQRLRAGLAVDRGLLPEARDAARRARAIADEANLPYETLLAIATAGHLGLEEVDEAEVADRAARLGIACAPAVLAVGARRAEA